MILSLTLCKRNFAKHKGFTLIEIMIAIVIIGIMAATATRVFDVLQDRRRYEATAKEMDELAKAIVGDPEKVQGGMRVDFGYVGDTGILPRNLNRLRNAAGVQGWNGPYVTVKFDEDPNDFRIDGWGTNYVYRRNQGRIISRGSDGAPGGSGYAADITKRILDPISKATDNVVNVFVRDGRGTTLTNVHVTVTITYPGHTDTPLTHSTGYFTINTIPIGNHWITITPMPDYAGSLGSEISSIIAVYPKGSGSPNMAHVRFSSAIPEP